jgi:hypothetical protein
MVEVEMGNNPQFGNSMGSELLRVKEHRIHALFPVTYKGTAEKEVPANFLDFWSTESGGLKELEVGTVLSDIGFVDHYQCPDNNQVVWKPLDKGLVLGDFYPYISQIMGGESNQLKG